MPSDILKLLLDAAELDICTSFLNVYFCTLKMWSLEPAANDKFLGSFSKHSSLQVVENAVSTPKQCVCTILTADSLSQKIRTTYTGMGIASIEAEGQSRVKAAKVGSVYLVHRIAHVSYVHTQITEIIGFSHI